MADVAVETKETPVAVGKEVAEETPETLKKVDDAATEEIAAEATAAVVAENGSSTASSDKEEDKKENGDAVDKPTSEESSGESAEEEQSNGDKKDDDDDDAEDTNGESTDAPAEAVKRKIEESKTEETSATPEKKAKLDESKEPAVEKEVNGAEPTEVAAEA